MLKIPKIAIVGRPNVGKSALFNRLLGRRLAIVDEAEGVTRDRLICAMDYNDRYFELIDTGGIDPKNRADFNNEVRAQAYLAIDEADALILVVNLQTGILGLDEEIAKILLRTKKPLLLAINKVDHPSKEPETHIFCKLGIRDRLPVSAQHGYNILELNDWIYSKLPEEVAPKPQEGLKIAVIGRPNVGKSTLLNYLLDEKRCIVSPIAGTTRDSLDCHVEFKGLPYTLIDTAGIRRRSKHEDVVEKFAHIRTENAIERSDIVLLMLDSNSGMTAQEKRLAKFIEKCGKGCILFFNKWDLIKGFRMEHCLLAVRKQVSFLQHCPAIFGSALKGRNLDKIFEEVAKIDHWRRERISTGELNRFLEKAIQFNHPPMVQGKRLRIYYLTQVSNDPPTFVLFINSIDLLDYSWKRYLIHKLRETHPFTGLPMRFILRDKTGAHRADFEEMEEMDAQLS
jgi:GTP-binding protein